MAAKKRPKFSTCRTMGKKKIGCCSRACAGLGKHKRKKCIRACMPGGAK